MLTVKVIGNIKPNTRGPHFGSRYVDKAVRTGQYFSGHAQTLHYYSFAGCTPLMLSITEGHLKTTIILLENGADITCSDIELNSPLSIAILNGQEDIIPLLLDNEVL